MLTLMAAVPAEAVNFTIKTRPGRVKVYVTTGEGVY